MNKSFRIKKDQKLKIELLGDGLVISIGFDALQFAAEENPEFEVYDEDAEKFIKPDVFDKKAFALSVLAALRDEEEDGTTEVHKLFDKAFEKAFEDCDSGVKLPESF